MFDVQSTNILISSDSDSQPFAYLFDLRNPGSAQNVIKTFMLNC